MDKKERKEKKGIMFIFGGVRQSESLECIREKTFRSPIAHTHTLCKTADSGAEECGPPTVFSVSFSSTHSLTFSFYPAIRTSSTPHQPLEVLNLSVFRSWKEIGNLTAEL